MNKATPDNAPETRYLEKQTVAVKRRAATAVFALFAFAYQFSYQSAQYMLERASGQAVYMFPGLKYALLE